jgi:hypothetical protein
MEPASTPPTTGATTTTTDPIAATKAAVVAAVVQARQDYVYATMNYDEADALTVFGQTTAPDSPSYQLGLANIAVLQSHGWRVRLNPDVPSVTTVEMTSHCSTALRRRRLKSPCAPSTRRWFTSQAGLRTAQTPS